MKNFVACGDRAARDDWVWTGRAFRLAIFSTAVLENLGQFALMPQRRWHRLSMFSIEGPLRERLTVVNTQAETFDHSGRFEICQDNATSSSALVLNEAARSDGSMIVELFIYGGSSANKGDTYD
jgi:hypothetical protein